MNFQEFRFRCCLIQLPTPFSSVSQHYSCNNAAFLWHEVFAHAQALKKGQIQSAWWGRCSWKGLLSQAFAREVQWVWTGPFLGLGWFWGMDTAIQLSCEYLAVPTMKWGFYNTPVNCCFPLVTSESPELIAQAG